MVPLHHQITLRKSGEESPPVPPPPPPQREGGEDTPLENCAKKRRVGTTNASLYMPFCTDVTSVIASLAIEGHTEEDGKRKPAPLTVQIEGAERGEDEGTVPAATTTAPAQLACHVGGACCEFGLQLSCETARCACRRVGCNCVSCWCLVRCSNVAPQTRQEEQRTTQRGPGDVEGKRRGERQQGRGKGAAARAQTEGSGRAEHTESNANAPGQRNVPRIPP